MGAPIGQPAKTNKPLPRNIAEQLQQQYGGQSSSEDDRDASDDSKWYSEEESGYDSEMNSDGEFPDVSAVPERDVDESDSSPYGGEREQGVNKMVVLPQDPNKIPPEYNYRLTMWSGQTHYDVVKEVAKFEHDYRLRKYPNSGWDLAWWDGPITL